MLDATLHYYILCTLTDFSGSLYRWENEAQCGLLSFLALGHNGTRVCTLVIWAQSFSVFDSFAILGSNAWFTLVRLGEMGGRKCHQTAINMHCPMGKQVNLGRVQGPETWGLLLDLFCFFSESQSWVACKRMNTHTHRYQWSTYEPLPGSKTISGPLPILSPAILQHDGLWSGAFGTWLVHKDRALMHGGLPRWHSSKESPY